MTEDSAAPNPPKARRFSRRKLLRRLLGGTIGSAAVAGLGGAYAYRVEPFWPKVERHQLDLPGLDPVFEGLRLMQLSDLHLHSNKIAEYLGDQLPCCRDLEPDLIVITGDFTTSGGTRFVDQVAKLLAPLSAPLGVFAVLGNHDWGIYSPRRTRRGSHKSDRTTAALTDIGITVLRNAAHRVTIGDACLQLVGLDDLWSDQCDPAAAFAEVATDTPCIALAHNPDTIDLLKDQPCDWILCGHTHGGQVRIPLLGAPLLPIRNRQYDAGLFDVADKRLYVNRGLGSLRQVRFNCRPEITIFTLIQKKRG